MTPAQLKIIFVVGAGAMCFGAGWAANGWRLRADIAEMKASRAEEITQASQVALADYKEGAEKIKAAASGAQVDLAAIGTQLAAIRKGQKNAPPPPLPDDCKPGPVRLRNLAETAAAADKAVAGPVTGK